MPELNPFRYERQFDAYLTGYRKSADATMVGTNIFLFIISFAFAIWSGEWLPVFLIGLPTLLLSMLLARAANGYLITRLFMGCAFMAFTGLFVHLAHGDIEAHFTAFGLIAILLYYRDWRVIAAATIFIYLHHLVLGLGQTYGLAVYVFDNPSFWATFGLHVAYFLPFVGMMGYLAIALRREGYQNQLVIELSNKVAQGDLRPSAVQPDVVGPRHALLDSVTLMHDRILQLLAMIPAPVIVVRKSDHMVVNVNDAWASEFNIDPNPKMIIGRRFPYLISQTNFDLIKSFLDANGTPVETFPMVFDWKSPEDRKRQVELRKIDYTTDLSDLMIIVGSDLTEQHRAETQLREIAYTDMLTSAANRNSLHIKLDEAVRNLETDYKPFAVILFDLDGFKQVNDTHGHDAGDLVLKTVVQRMMRTLEHRAFVARLGGDEFVAVLEDTDNSEHCLRYAEYLIRQIVYPVRLQSFEEVSISASAGIRICAALEEDLSASTILKAADIALYRAKAAGKAGAVVYSEDDADLERCPETGVVIPLKSG